MACLVAFVSIWGRAVVSSAADFTAAAIHDHGDVVVMEVEGCYDADHGGPCDSRLARKAVASEFYATHPDDYDFLVIFTNFPFKMPAENTAAFYLPVRNDTRGVGIELYDNSSSYGSNGKLQGTLDMGSLTDISSDPLDPGFEFTMTTLSHELLHRWAAHVTFIDENGQVSEDLLGKKSPGGEKGSHWSYLLNTSGSVLYGNRWRDNGDGTFSSLQAWKYYSPLDMYLAGLYHPFEVPPMLLIDQPAIDPEKLPEAGVTITGTSRTVTIDDIIAAEGERIPGADQSQKDFRIGFVLAVRPGGLIGPEVGGVRTIVRNWVIRHSSLTHGRSRLLVDDSPFQTIPVNPGPPPLPHTSRETPPLLEDGVAWLMNHQKLDGSWADKARTEGLDTAEAVIALGSFRNAEQNHAAGIRRLSESEPVSVDFLSRKIEALGLAGEEASALVDELISHQNPDGGWGSGPGRVSNGADAALALKALAAAGFSNPDVIEPGLSYLKAVRDPYGAWGRDDQESDLPTTANVLTVFKHSRETTPLDEEIGIALAWLRERQRPDGGFGSEVAAAYDTALALTAVHGLEESDADVESALLHLLGLQSADGSWHESVHETALVVNALYAWRDVLKVDLAILDADITFIPAAVTRKPEDVTVTALVRKTGLTAANGIRVALYDGEIAVENKVDERVIDVGGPSEVAATFSVTISDFVHHRFHVVLDPDDEVEELSEANNIASNTLPNELNMAPDLSVDPGEISLSPAVITRVPQTVAISASIRNSGYSAAPGVTIALHDGDLFSATRLEERTVDVGPQSSTPVVFSTRVDDAEGHRFFIAADPGNEIEETVESNNTASAFLPSEPTYDLEVLASDLSTSPPAPGQGETVVISSRIRNFGTRDAFNVSIRFTIDAGSGQTIIASAQLDLPSGATVDYAFQWKASIAGPDLRLAVHVDPADAYDELSETNNTAFIPLPVTPHAEPNLALGPEDISIAPSPALEGGGAVITAVVHNTGGVDLGDVRVDFFQAAGPGENQLIGSRVINGPPAGASAPAELNWTGISVSGDRLITVIADPENRIREYNEQDNQTIAPLTILPLPDLAISPDAITYTPDAPGQGEVVSVEVVVQNLGGQDAADAPLTAREDGELLFETTLPLVKAHSETTLSFPYDTAGKTGFHTIAIHVDPLATIPEQRRDNNTAARVIGVQDADLWVSERYISPNGDGVRDETIFFFRLKTVRDVVVVVVNDADETIRTWTGPEFQQTAGGAVPWDGLTGEETVAPDGDYRIQVVDASGIVLNSLPVTVDNNRWPLALAFGTEHLLEISADMATHAHEGVWLPDDGGVLYEDDGLHIGPANGNDPVRLGPDEWDDASIWRYSHWSLSGDGERIAFFYNPDDGESRNRLWVMDRYGSSPTLVDSLASTYYSRPRLLAQSSDGSALAYVDYVGGRRGYHTYIVQADGSGKRLLEEWSNSIYELAWSPDGQELAYALNASGGSSIEVTDQWGDAVDAFTFDAPSITDMRWLADGMMLVHRNDGSGAHRFWLVDARGGGEPILLPVSCGSGLEFTISPNRRRIAFACFENDALVVTLADLTGDAALLYEGEPVDIIWNELKHRDPKITWSPDNRKIAFIDYRLINQCDHAEAFLTTIDAATLERSVHPIPGSKGCYGYDCTYTLGVGCYAYPPDAGDPRENRLAARHVSFFRDNRRVLIPQDYQSTIMDSVTGDVIAAGQRRADSDKPPTHSPSGAYITLAAGSAGVVAGSLLNLTADLHVKREESYILFNGFAADLHFDRYTLEWADAAAPDQWRPIQPPSGSQVVNGELGVWIPPRPGVFFARLSAFDLAGNVVRMRKRIPWSRALTLVGLHKEGALFSPNGDGASDSVTVRYTVLEPVYLRFLIHDDRGALVRTLARVYPDPGPGGQEDHIVWNGADEHGATVPDGIYRLTVLDYEVAFEVDNTPPEAAVEIGRIDCGPEAGSNPRIYSNLTGLAMDRNMTRWVVEYGEGVNPSAWHELARGAESLFKPDETDAEAPALIDTFLKRDLTTYAGHRFRLTAEDAAGNRTTASSGIFEELLILQEVIDVEVDKAFDIAFQRTEAGGFVFPGDGIEVEPPGPLHAPFKLVVLETIGAPLVELHVRNTVAGQTIDAPAAPHPGDRLFQIPWNELICLFPSEIVIRAVDENGVVHTSNPVTIGCVSSEEKPDVGFSLSGGGGGPGDMGGEPGGGGGGFGGLGGATCHSKSDGILQLRTEWKAFTPRAVSATYYITDDVEPDWSGENQLLHTVDLTSETFSVITIDTLSMEEGDYWIMVDLEHLDMNGVTRHLRKSAPFSVTHEAPRARIDEPDVAEMVCPDLFGPPGDEWPGVVVTGEASVGRGAAMGSYTLYYEKPGPTKKWIKAKTPYGCDDAGPCPISGNTIVSGGIGVWDVSHLEDGAYSLRLEVIDRSGKAGCDTVPILLDKPIFATAALDKTMISPNGDDLLDEVEIFYHVDGEGLVDIEVRDAGEHHLSGPVVRTITRGESHSAGDHAATWDGMADDGLAAPDGPYSILIHTMNACGTVVRRFAGRVAVDNTPPGAAILHPTPIDLVGVMVEVRGAVEDDHLDAWRLEVLNEEGRVLETLAEERDALVEETLATWNTSGHDGVRVLRLWAGDLLGNSAETSVRVDLADRREFIGNLSVAPRFFSPNGDGRSDAAWIDVTIDERVDAPLDLLIEIAAGEVIRKTFTLDSVLPGSHRFRWGGMDDAGLPAPDQEYTVTVTASDPSAPDLVPDLLHVETATAVLDRVHPEVRLQAAGGAAYVATDPVVTGSILDENLADYAVTWAGNGAVGVVEQGKQTRVDHVFGIIPGLTDGDHVLTAMAEDRAGNVTERRVRFVMDRTPPRPSLHSPPPEAVFGGDGAAVQIQGVVDEANPAAWTIRYGSGSHPGTWTELSSKSVDFEDAPSFYWPVDKGAGIPDGTYTLSLHVVDKAGWEAEARAVVAVDNTPPALAVTNPAEGQWVTAAADVVGSVTDAHLLEYTAALSAGSCADAFQWAPIRTSPAPVEDGLLARLGSLPADGPYCIRVSASDVAGNQAQTAVNLTVDAAPPAPPVLSAALEDKTDVHLHWTGSVEPDLAGFHLYRDGVKRSADLLVAPDFVDRPTGEGVYTWRVTAVDFAGNESAPSNPATFTVDLTPPLARIQAPGRNALARDMVAIKGTAYSDEDFRQYRVYAGQGPAPAVWSLLHASPLPTRAGLLAEWDALAVGDGVHTLRLEAEDLSGNIAVHDISVVVDNTPPAAPVLLSAGRPNPDASNVRIRWRVGAEPDLAGCLLYRNDEPANLTGNVIGDMTPWLLHGDAYDDENLPDGAFSYHLMAMDHAGNLSAASNSRVVEIDSRPPRLEITAPPDQHAFDAPILIRAESPDLDVARVQFQWRAASGQTWNDLDDPAVAPPYMAYLDPGALGLAPGAWHIRARGADHGGRIDDAPPWITVNLTDVTPPGAPRDLAGRMDAAGAALSWSPGEEADLHGWHVYRLQGETPLRINPAIVTEPLFVDSGRPDGKHQYEITAVDEAGNESAPSNRADVRIYTPGLQRPFFPTPLPEISVQGWNVGPGDQVEWFVDSGAGPVSAGVVTADASGRFSRVITLAPGQNAITARASNEAGGQSPDAAPAIYIYDPPPARPDGLTATVADRSVALSWNANTEPDLAGYSLYRDGERMNALTPVQSGWASASRYSYPNQPSRAIDGSRYTYWYIDEYSISDAEWWELNLYTPEMIHRLDVDFRYTSGSARDYEIQAWSGREWVVLESVTGNEDVLDSFDLVPPRPIDRVRIHMTAFNWAGAPRIRIYEFTPSTIVPIIGETHQDHGLATAVHTYRLGAVDRNGFESPLTDELRVEVGDATPPDAPRDLAAEVAGADVTLTWSPCTAPDLAGYIVEARSDQGWTRRNALLLTETTFSEPALRNGTHGWRVIAEDAVGNRSAPSDPVEAVIDLGRPAPPTHLLVTAPPDGAALEACWSHEGGAAGFILHRSETPGGPYTPAAPDVITDACRVDEGLTDGVVYYYVVTAVDPVGNESDPSGEASGTPREHLPPGAPALLQPTTPGYPIKVDSPEADVSGLAEAGAEVTLFVNERPAGSVQASDLDIRTLLFYHAYDHYTISRDGRFMAYLFVSNGTMFIKDFHTGEYGRHGPLAHAMTWFPDGRRILLVKRESSSHDHRLVILDWTDGVETLLTDDDGAVESAPNISDDGRKIAFISDRDGAPAIWVLDADAGALERIAGGDVHRPRLSPDGTLLAHASPGSRTLTVTDLADGSVVLAEDHLPLLDSGEAWFAWAPRENRLAFTSTRNGAPDLYVWEAETGAARQITDSDETELSMAWSPLGRRLAYAAAEGSITRMRVVSTRDPIETRDLYSYRYEPNIGPIVWGASGKLIFRDGSQLRAILPAGHFIAEGVELDMGSNLITAEAVDASGNTGPRSDAISLFFDPNLLPDLEITEGDLYIHPSAPVEGDRITAVLFFRNRNLTPAEGVTLDVHILDAEGRPTPAASETFQRVDPGEEEFVSFSRDSSGAVGEIRIVALLDADDAIRESDETNNLAVTTIRIAPDRGVTMSTTLDFDRYENGEEMAIDVTLSNDGPPGPITLEAWIETAGGAYVGPAGAAGLQLPHGVVSHRFTWPVGFIAGPHLVRVVATRGDEAPVENTTPFHVEAHVQLEAALALADARLGPDEDAVLTVNLKNGGSEPVIPALEVLLRVTRADGAVLFSESRPLANLLRGTPVRMTARWNTGRNAPGLHHAEVRVFIDGQPVAESTRPFEILQRIHLIGALAVSNVLPTPGETVYADYTLQNDGNANTGDLALQAVLMDPDALTDIAIQETPVSADVNERIVGRFAFSTSGLSLKTYWIMLRVDGADPAENGSLSVASFTVKDLTPPSLTILSPADAGVFGPGASPELVVSALDNASGVARVEYRLDEGEWKLLPAADRANGLYITRLSVVGLEPGAHRISARGVDASGNTSIPIAAFITMELYPTLYASKTDALLVDVNQDGQASPGDTLRYRVEILNQGVADARSVVFRDAFDDPHLTLKAGSVVAGAGAAVSGNAIGDVEARVEIGLIPPSSPAVVITMDAVIDGRTPAGVPAVANQGVVTRAAPGDLLTDDPDAPNSDDPTRTPVAAGPAPEADLSVVMTDDPDPVIAGQHLLYVIVVENGGPGEAPGVLLLDNTPAGLLDPEYSLDGGASWNPWNGVLKMGDLPAGQAASALLRGTADRRVAAPETWTNAASVASDAADPAPENNQALQTTRILPAPAEEEADLAVSMTDEPDPVAPGRLLVYTITTTNNGPAAAVDVTLIGGASPGFLNPECSLDNGSSWLPWTGALTLGDLAAGGASRTLLRGAAAENVAGALTASVAVSSDIADPNPADNQAAQTTEIIGDAPGDEADLAVSMTDDPDPVAPGQLLVYTITTTNNGSATAADVTLIGGASPGFLNPECSLDNGSSWLPWTGALTLGDLAAGGAIRTLLRGAAAENVAGALTASVTVASDIADPNPADNQAAQTTGIIGDAPGDEADLSIAMTDNPDPITAGHTATYTITIANAGPSAARAVRLSDDPPADLSIPEHSLDYGSTWSPWPGVLDLGDLPAGEARVVFLRGVASAGITGPFTNHATVVSDVPDPNPTDNEAFQTTGVHFNPPSGWMTVNVGDWPDLAWRMVWINNNAARPLEVLVGDMIPDGVFFTRGSLVCEARGETTTTLCAYDASIDAIAWRGVMAPDPGAPDERRAGNELVITFRTRASTSVTEVRNQGLAFWDQNGDGRTDVSDPNLRDNAPVATSPEDGALARQSAHVFVPGLNPWGMVFFMMLLGILGVRRLRRESDL